MSGFVDSSYKFTSPVRKFKANDPYYYEVDNIPLGQLEENILWLKDQLQNSSQVSGVGRSDLNELRPFAEGGNNVIVVNPGRYTARINDAYNKSPIQKLSMLSGSSLGSFNQFNNPSGTTLATSVLTKIKSSTAANALNLNGLIERITQWTVFNEDFPGNTAYENNLPIINPIAGKWPLLNNSDFYTAIAQAYASASELQRMSNEFIKQFRGVARTAIVDVPAELKIAVPKFDENDFFYYDTAGVKQAISGSQVRIDLVFVYSKPIDASSAAIQKWSGGQPTNITSPVLGIVKGAGIGYKVNAGSVPSPVGPALDANGNTQILAATGDQALTTNGFQGLNIHGSFPSPDDLMNLAPVISEKLSENDPQLIGQSILPIAYVVVRKTAATNAIGNVVLTDSDVIDIRPFFRTAELTYNERAGIAAAMPSLSLANPVVTKYELEREANRLYSYINQATGADIVSPKVVAGGMVWGGLLYGPEGAINDVLTRNGITQNLFTNPDVPFYPDWDLANWWDFSVQGVSDGGVSKGEKRNDRVNIYEKYRNINLDGGVGVPAGLLSIWDESSTGKYYTAWVSKKFFINKNDAPWMTDYRVNVSLENCIGISFKADNETTAVSQSGSFGTYVERFSDYFVIYVFWTPSDIYSQEFYPQSNRDNNKYTQWVVRSSLFPNPTVPNQGGAIFPLLGACNYPSLSFEVVGYPQNWFSKALPQYPNTPLLNFR